MNESWIGIDVSKRKLDAAAVDGRGKIKSRVFTNDADGYLGLMHWFRERGLEAVTARVCLEATGPYSEAVACALADAGWCVSVVNPARVKGFAQSELTRNKTDRADAALLARFGAALRPEPWQAPTPEIRQLRALVDRLQALKDMHQQEANRLEGQSLSTQPVLIQSIRSHMQWLADCIKALEQEIDDHIDKHPALRRDAALITSIPGLGDRTSAKVLAYLGDVRRFRNAKAMAAFIGVTPRLKISGSSVRGRSMLSRTGHAAVRHALYMPAMVALRYNPAVRAFGERLRSGGLAPKAVIGAAMHKLTHLIYGVIRSGLPFNPDLAMPRLDFQDGI